MDPLWLTRIGLALDIIGAVLFSIPVGAFASRAAVRRAALDWGLGVLSADTDEENERFAPVQDRIREAALARFGMVLLAFGFGFQLAATFA